MSTLGHRIKMIRENLNLTGEEFGKKLNVTKVAVSNWENNNRKPDTEMLVKIAELGDVSTDYLLGRTNNPNSKIVQTTIGKNNYRMEIDKSYPYDLQPDEVKELFKNLESSGFDVNKLIKKIKNNDNN